MDRIDRFDDDFRFLSNFWPTPVKLSGDVYPTVEHAYQAAKTLDPEERKRIREIGAPGRARTAGKSVALRPAWDDIRLNVMRDLVWQKFSEYPDLRTKLLATGDADLAEGNTWDDVFWGTDAETGKGENNLGKILMETRTRIRDQTAAVLFARRVAPELDLFEDMLKRAKIQYQKEPCEGRTVITVEAGYAGFVSEIAFGRNGELLSVEAYE